MNTASLKFPTPLRGFLNRMAYRALRANHGANPLSQRSHSTLKQNLTRQVLFYRPIARLVILLLAVFGAFAGLFAPWYQKVFIDTLSRADSASLNSTWNSQLLLNFDSPLVSSVVFAFLAMLATQSCALLVRMLSAREGALIHAALSDALYTHTLRLTSESRGSKTVGEIVNLYAQDVAAAASLLEDFYGSAVGALIPLAAAPFFVSAMLGMPLTVVMAVSLICILVLILMSWRQSQFFSAFKRLAGERLGIVNEWLQNMRVIRILDWIEAFEKRIFAKRIEETENRIGMVTNGSVMNSIAQVAPLLINVVGIMVLIDYKKGAATAGDIFALMWVFGVFMARPIRNTPWTLVMFLDGLTSCRRLEKFFAAPVESRAFLNAGSKDFGATTKLKSDASGVSLEVKGLNLSLGGKQILKDVAFSVAPGEFIAIRGEVGVGKTQLLLSLLRDSPAKFQMYSIGGKDFANAENDAVRPYFVYVPQDGFVMSASLRENIAFFYDAGASLDEQILHSLKLADFDPVREKISGGLSAEIGERGVNLSGGQKQRVGMARAHYQGEHAESRGIVLLDDCLSAVDVETEAKLIAQLISGAWRHKTRLLVTHRLSVLEHADQVWLLEDGKLIVERGRG